jgi:DNA-binding beta-propeller fold protein YncE
VTTAYNATTGAQLWQVVYYGAKGAQPIPGAIALSPDGSRLFVTGTAYSTCCQQHLVTIAYDAASGARLWTARGPATGAGPLTIAASPDGSAVFVASDAQFAIVSYDAASGVQLWVATYQAGAAPQWMALSPNGSRLFTIGGVGEYVTVAYRA